MKLKNLQTYQSVTFNKKNETHFNVDKPAHKGISMQLMPDAGYVRIEMEGADTVLVFATNIAYATPADELAVKPAAKPKAQETK